MAAKSVKNRGSANISRSFKTTIKPKEEWRVRLKDHNIFNSNYSFDVLLLVESNYKLCPATSEIEEQGEESTAVKFLTPSNLIKFLMNTFTSRPEYEYFSFYEEAYTELQEEYRANNKLSPESFVYLIKLRILAYNEIIAQDRELIRQLKFSLEQEMKTLNEPQHTKGEGSKAAKHRLSRSTSLKQTTLDSKYLQAKAGKIPNFVETRKIPTIYNTDYDEPNPENIYYVLSGIYDASVLPTLQKCNIPILSLIELSMKGVTYNVEEMVVENLDEIEFDRMLSMRSFWRSLTQDKTDIPKISKNTCYIKYSIPDPNTETPSFDHFLMLLKNISDFKRLYYHYFSTVRYLDVEEFRKPICLSSMNSYNGFLDQIPNECISIPLMLHALLDEVCVRVDNWSNEQLITLKNNKKGKRKYHGGPVVQIKSLLREYDCSHKKIPPIINMPKAVKISYGNTLDYINAHVPINKYINTTEITLNGLKKTLPLKLFEKIDASNTFDIMFYNYVFSKWSEQLTNVSVEELTLCVYAYLFTRGNFRNLNISKVPSIITKVNKITECMFGVTKLHNEQHKVLSVKLNASFLKTNSSVQSDKLPTVTNAKKDIEEDDVVGGINSSCDNLSQQYATFAEELDPASFVQMINIAANNYNHFDYKYFAPTDAILLRFHYTNDKCGFSVKNEKYFLRTPLCFRDFCYELLLEDAEWFLKEEKEYWKQMYVNKEKEKEYLMKHPKVDYDFDPKEFIIPGSIKQNLDKTRAGSGRKSLTRSSKGERRKSSEVKNVLILKKSLRKSRESSYSGKPEGSPNRTIGVPLCEPYDKAKTYAFEIYNLEQRFYPLEFEEILYRSLLSVKLTKQQLPKRPLSCTFVVSSQNVNLVLHCKQDVIFKPVKPLYFNVNMTNGVVMVFSIPSPPIIHVENRHIVMHKMNNDERRNDSIKSTLTKVTIGSSGTDVMEPKISELKNEVLQYLSIAMKEQLPVFKIISSRLHKYQYVKRIKSKISLPVGKIYRRVCCKPILYKRLSKQQNIYEAKCVPYSDLVNKERSPIDWKWNCSIPTGLSMETVQANVPNDFYVRQRYVIERTDLPSIEDETYRCYLRCGIIMKFLKDGSIKTLSPDKTLSHYKYGYFSSNKRRASKANTSKDVRLKRQTNVIPLHAYKKNLTSLEKRVRKISKKYKRHLIDIADNYRFERSRADSRKLHKIYKLSKKIYTKDSHVIPLINHNVITSDGRFIDVKNNVVHDTYRKYEETRHRDYLLNETVTRREDGTSWMIDKCGNAITQFPDGSRIKTWYTILNENLLLEQDPTEYQKGGVTVVEETESLTKYCQTTEEFDIINEEEDVEVLYNKEPVREQSNSVGFILVGMNYSFEHPNFATVSYYCWEDSSADVLMPDKINVTVYAGGTYKLKLINNDTINVNTEDVEFVVHNTETMKQDICSIYLAAFSGDKPKPERTLLSVKENDQKVFSVLCDGQIINKKSYTPNSSTLETMNSVCSDRMFVMKRDLSGMEMIKEPIPYKFVHTLVDLKDVMSRKKPENVIIGPTKIKIFEPLRKTYSEHLMMMYDIPILATTNERLCLDKLWKLHDLDINAIVPKRSPLLIYERYISCLPSQIIVEQLAQAVLKCIIEGNENLPNINMIQDLVETEEIVAKSEKIEEKISFKKPIPKHLTYKKHLDKYKQLTKIDSIPPYFHTVRGLMFLAVEECSEGAMEESSARQGSQTHKKKAVSTLQVKEPRSTVKSQYQKIKETEKKIDKRKTLEKQKAFSKSESFMSEKLIHKSSKGQSVSIVNAFQTNLNVPNHIAIHLKPNAHVHDIILTANGLQIITDKNLENFYYPVQDSQRSKQQINTNAEKNYGKGFVEEKRETKPVNGFDAEPSGADINEKYPSFLGEDIGDYFTSSVKTPSWDDSLCQKSCVNSFITATNTLVTIPEHKQNEGNSCKQSTCACSVDSIERLAKCCQCKKYYCNCKDKYSPFATCALQNELNVSEAVCVLATKIIQTIDKDATKFNLLSTKLENIIRDTANAWSMSESITNDLIKTLKWIIDNKLKKQNTIPEENAIDIVKQIEATVSKIKIATRTIPLTIGNLQKMADLVLKLVCNSKNNINIAKEIRKLLRDAKISRVDIIDTLKLAKEKIHLYYEHGLYQNLSIPEIPPESKCCKIAQYIDYLLDSILEGACEKCNTRNFVTNTSIHNTSPVSYGSKASFQKSGVTTTQESYTKKPLQLEPQTPNNSNIMNYEYEKEKPNIIVEPLDSPVRDTQTNDDDAFDISSAGGFSLIKSCTEVVDVSIPFINNENTNVNVNENSKANIVKSREEILDEDENKYLLSKIKFSSISDIPDAKVKDIITIMAPEQNLDSGIINDEHSYPLLSPLLHSAQRTQNTKPIVYDGNIISK